jgi:hypothetical protein
MSDSNEVLPVQRFSPAPGIWVDRTEKSVAISGAMQLHGDEANAARAHSIEHAINASWNSTFPDGYSVTCNVTVRYRGRKSSADDNATQIEAKDAWGPSHVGNIPGVDRSMTLNASEGNDVWTWTPAHEFGHIIGLKDRYSESIMSSIRGAFGGTRSTTAHPGYQMNLMAEQPGRLESKNVADLATENEPSSWGINDDVQVRDWVTAHTTAEVGKLSTASKLKAIKTLMGGWIDDDDVAAIGTICSCVPTKAEADAIRNGVDLSDFFSPGQRTKVRGFFDKMP